MKHILIIDDDPIILKVLGARLQQEGYEMLYAHDGNEGLKLAQEAKPDLVMTDYRMPNMGGLAMVGRMKMAEDTKNIPILMLTSEDFNPEALDALAKLGVNQYVHKSAAYTDILAAVKKILAE